MTATSLKTLLLSAGLMAGGCLAGYAGSFTANFDDGQIPAGTHLEGVAGGGVIEASGGVNGSGVLKLTKSVNSQQGAFVIDNLDADVTDGVNSVDVTFKMRVGGGTSTPADGFSFAMGSALPYAVGSWSEEGAGSGLIVAFDIYDNGSAEAPAIDIKWNGIVVSHNMKAISFLRTGTAFVDVRIQLQANGMLLVSYNGNTVVSNLLISGFAPITGAMYGFGARTGGLNENQWVDDLSITTTTGALAPMLTLQPKSIHALADKQVTFRAQVNFPAIVTALQWLQKAPGAADFTPVPAGGDQVNYTTELLTPAMDGTQLKLSVAAGEVTIESDPVTLYVEAFVPPTPTVSFNFDDAAVPANTTVYGTATAVATGGVDNSGMLSLTEAANDQNGAWIIGDLNGGQAVGSLTALFSLQLGPGTDRPADGFSFNWANNVPDALVTTGVEEGAGTGLTVCFDTWDSNGLWDGTGEAPALDVKWGGTTLATLKLPIERIELSRFADVLIRLSTNGLLDVAYDGEFLFWKVPLPGFSSVANARFYFGARTGGANENHYVDNVAITTGLYTGPILLVKEPASAVVLPGATVSLTTEVNDPVNALYQWQKKGPADSAFADIAAASAENYTTPALAVADSPTQYRLIVTGPFNNTTSQVATVLVLDLARPTANLDIDLNFDDGLLPPDCALYNEGTTGLSGYITPNGGVNDSGVLHITDTVNSAAGTFLDHAVIQGGRSVDRFVAAFALRLDSPGSPADGMGFDWATDLPEGISWAGEDGLGTGLSVCIDTWDNGGGEAPAVTIKWGGVVVTNMVVPIAAVLTGGSFAEVLVGLNANGTLDLAYGGRVVFYHLPLPGFKALTGASFGFYGRTGGANENVWIDNFAVRAWPSANPPTIIAQPLDQLLLPDTATTLRVQVSDPPLVTYQWQQKAPGAAAAWANIAGATAADLPTPLLGVADNGTQYRVIMPVSVPLMTLTSRVATVTVIDLTDAIVNFDFNDGQVPAGSHIVGTTLLDTAGGVEDSAVIKLTTAPNGSQVGSYFIDDLAGGLKVSGMTAAFKLRMDDHGANPPADGLSFVWGEDIGESAFGEDGSGSGLVISIDTWDNSVAPVPPEAPAIDALYNGEQLGHTMVTAATLNTEGQYVPVIVRVNPGGKLDVCFNGQLYYQGLTMPGFTGFTGARFGFGARTGGAYENHWVDDIQIAVTLAPSLSISIARSGENVVITYEGVLETANTVSGPYTEVAGATSPLTLKPTAAQQFFRTRE